MLRLSGSSARDVSVIVVTFNSSSVIADCLRSLSEHLPEAQIVVVDNGSEDETVAIAQRNPNVRLINGHGNVGFGAGVNLGARTASGDLLMVLNPDATVVGVDATQLNSVCEDAVTGIIGCRLRNRSMRYRYPKFAVWGWRSELHWTLSEHFLIPREVAVPRPRIRGRQGRFWIAGAAFLVSRREFLSVGGFDSSFFLYYEDCDLSRAYGARGLPIRTTAAITVAHLGGHSSPRYAGVMTGYTLLGLLQYVAKWEGPAAARDAAARCMQLLGAIETVGGRLAPVPVLGPRAVGKQRSALSVRLWLIEAAAARVAPGPYPHAITAIRSVLSGDRSNDLGPDAAVA
jgi:N-acetylglucosaminyl-diphospho-decaprenol L-rhamnosyltransferase